VASNDFESSRRPKRVAPRPIDAEACRRRRLIENIFGKLKEFRRIALRACKTDASFPAMLDPAAPIIATR